MFTFFQCLKPSWPTFFLNDYIYIFTFFEVAMSKKFTPLWREAHFQVKMLKALGVRTDVQISFRMAGARDCAPCQKSAKRDGFVAFP